MKQLSEIVLMKGSHVSAEAGMCFMEAVAYFAKETHSDQPKCACPVLTKYMITLNDSLLDDERQLLKPYIKRFIGTRDGNAQKRADILAWASIVEFTPHCLRLIGLNNEADALQSVNKFDWSAAESAAWSAALSAARSAALSAASSAKSAALSAAESAAESAAWSARSAAWAAESAAESAKIEKSKARRIVIEMALKALEAALVVSETIEVKE